MIRQCDWCWRAARGCYKLDPIVLGATYNNYWLCNECMEEALPVILEVRA